MAHLPVLMAAALTLATASTSVMIATTTSQPGKRDAARVAAGIYAADPDHTQVVWSVNHDGFSILQGMFPAPSGTLTIDPANLAAASVDVTIRIDQAATTSSQFASDLKAPKLLNAAAFPTARFVSNRVTPRGDGRATIAGLLTLMGVSRPVSLDATFVGAGTDPNSHKATIGFGADATIKRSDFGIDLVLPTVSDEVRLHINAAFVEA